MDIQIYKELIEYQEAMNWFVDTKEDRVFILEHKDVYTAGKSIKDDIKNIRGVPVVYTNRGGLWTWHGKGQVIVYFVYNLHKHNMSLTDFFQKTEDTFVPLLQNIIDASKNKYLVFFDDKKRGFWVKDNITYEIAKIGFIGLRVSSGVLSHGISINYCNDLRYFDFIDPCGLGKVKISSIYEFRKDKKLLNNIEVFKEQIANIIKNTFV